MEKIKLTKGELKRQWDALRRYQRYLPTLQLKKQQLQAQILVKIGLEEEAEKHKALHLRRIIAWAGLLVDPQVDIRAWIRPEKAVLASENIAGVELPVFERLEFVPAEYDLFATPAWVDAAIEAFRKLVSINKEIETIKQSLEILHRHLRITIQRVNLFEKVKIPGAEEAIRRIKIYIGDQMANAVGRSKIAKRKIEALALEEVLV